MIGTSWKALEDNDYCLAGQIVTVINCEFSTLTYLIQVGPVEVKKIKDFELLEYFEELF